MKKRKISDKFEIKPLYTVSEIVAYTHGTFDKDKVHHLIRKHNIVLFRVGRSIFIPLQEIKKKLPSLWQAMALAHSKIRPKAVKTQVVSDDEDEEEAQWSVDTKYLFE